MATIIKPSLFSWNDVEARSDLDRFYLVRDKLPDEKIVIVSVLQQENSRTWYFMVLKQTVIP